MTPIGELEQLYLTSQIRSRNRELVSSPETNIPNICPENRCKRAFEQRVDTPRCKDALDWIEIDRRSNPRLECPSAALLHFNFVWVIDEWGRDTSRLADAAFSELRRIPRGR